VAWFNDPLDGYLPVDEAAEQMGLTEARVRELVRQRVLRGRRCWGALYVEPAITNYT
jgi:excisionase family DNA binding protein